MEKGGSEMRGFREIRECERPGDNTGPTTFSEEAMKKYNALFTEDIKSSEKEEALGVADGVDYIIKQIEKRKQRINSDEQR